MPIPTKQLRELEEGDSTEFSLKCGAHLRVERYSTAHAELPGFDLTITNAKAAGSEDYDEPGLDLHLYTVKFTVLDKSLPDLAKLFQALDDNSSV